MIPVLEYSSTAWSTTAKTNQQSLDKIQNQAIRIITGAMKSTPITFMEQTTAIQPLQQRRQAKVLLQAEKYKCLPEHPLKEKVEGRTKNRIKRSSFTHEVKMLQKDFFFFFSFAYTTSPAAVMKLVVFFRSSKRPYNFW